MRFAPVLVAGMLSLPAFAAAPFTGTIEMKITNDRAGQGTMKLSIGEGGVVSELQTPGPTGQPMHMKTLLQKAHPDRAILVNDATKSWGEMPLPPTPPAPADDVWTVKKLGTDTIAGFKAVHVSATSSKGASVELWTAKGIMDAGEFARAQGGGNRIPSALIDALKKAGADGFFAKTVSKGQDGSTTTMEVTKVTKAKLPASTFEVPSGYTKSSNPSTVALPPDVQKQIEEKMKNMTPEQQEMLKRAMQAHGAH